VSIRYRSTTSYAGGWGVHEDLRRTKLICSMLFFTIYVPPRIVFYLLMHHLGTLVSNVVAPSLALMDLPLTHFPPKSFSVHLHNSITIIDTRICVHTPTSMNAHTQTLPLLAPPRDCVQETDPANIDEVITCPPLSMGTSHPAKEYFTFY
jgi:hypothetical protein